MSWASYEPMGSLQPMPPPMNPGMMSQGQGQGQGQGPSQMPHQLERRPPIYNNPKNNNVEVPNKTPSNKDKSTLEDVSEYENIYDWIIIVIAALIIEVLVISLVRFCPDIFGKAINIWFNRFKLSAVLADLLTLIVGFGITRYIYSELIYPKYEWNPMYFVGLSGLVQVLYDLFFYFVVIRPSSQGQNTMIDVLREYSVAGGSKILGADALKSMGTSVVAMLLKSAPLHVSASLAILSAYVVPFTLETKNTYSNIA